MKNLWQISNFARPGRPVWAFEFAAISVEAIETDELPIKECTDCVCSGGHCAAVGGFAALRMRRPLYGE